MTIHDEQRNVLPGEERKNRLRLTGWSVAAAALLSAILAPALLPNVADDAMQVPYPTHYMLLLMSNQPWNLIIFMLTVFALFYAVIFIDYDNYNDRLDGRSGPSFRAAVRRFAIAALVIYFTVIDGYLLWNAVRPLTSNNAWHGSADWLAVGLYLLALLPLLGIGAIEFGIIGRYWSESARRRWHTRCVKTFIVFGHAAMIFGMSLTTMAVYGWTPPAGMPGMGM